METPNPSTRPEETPITETMDDYKYGHMYTITYLPSYRERVIMEIMKDESCYEDSPEVQQATFEFAKRLIEAEPGYITSNLTRDTDELKEMVSDFRSGYIDCLKRHDLPNPTQHNTKELQIIK